MRLIVGAVIALTAFGAFAGAADYNNHVDVGVFGLVIGDYGGHYERNLNDYISLRGGVAFMPSFTHAYNPEDEEDIKSWTVFQTSVAGNFWPLGDFRRLFLMVEMGVDFHNVEANSGETGSATAFRPGVLIGWRWVLAERATLTLGGGSDYMSVHAKAGDEEGIWEGVWPRAEFGLGFLF